MLAIYAADPASPSLETDLSTVELYGRLMENFTLREVAKSDPQLDGDELVERARDQRWRLSVAAFAMFNRGRQDISDAELGADLNSLGSASSGAPRPIELGRRLISQFFFIHAARAMMNKPGETWFRYEFLHATFGEYLIATSLVDILADTASMAFSPKYGTRKPDDDLLFALLSHQILMSR